MDAQANNSSPASGNQMQSTSGQTDVKELSKECILCEKLIYKNQAWGRTRIRNVLVISGDVIEVFSRKVCQ